VVFSSIRFKPPRILSLGFLKRLYVYKDHPQSITQLEIVITPQLLKPNAVGDGDAGNAATSPSKMFLSEID